MNFKTYKIKELNRIFMICVKGETTYYYDHQNDSVYYGRDHIEEGANVGLVAFSAILTTAILRDIDSIWMSLIDNNALILWGVPAMDILMIILAWYFGLCRFSNPELILRRAGNLYTSDIGALIEEGIVIYKNATGII